MSPRPPKIVIINRSDATGGAAVVSRRLMEALRQQGADARMLVAEKLTESPFIELAAKQRTLRRSFLTERLKIFIANCFNRDTLFKIDTASDGVPLWRHRWVHEADAIILNWVNQGMLSLKGVRKLARLGKPILWTMHDMWNFTGICHHAGRCSRFDNCCGECPLLGRKASATDLSNAVWKQKKALYDDCDITFVAVSNWLRNRAMESSLLRNRRVEVIPNAFPIAVNPDTTAVMKRRHPQEGTFTVAFGAARLDDPVKGFPILIEATKTLRRNYPEVAKRTRLILFGDIRDATLLKQLEVDFRHVGRVGAKEVEDILLGSNAVLSTSLYETLPGTLIEGQAAGCFPVAFDRGGQPDIISHQATGWIARFNDDPAEAGANIAEGLVWAASRPDSERPKLIDSVAEKFAAKRIASRYLSLIKSMT